MDQVKPEGTNRLQLESQRMEERLRMLKQLMSVEKAQRDASSRGEPRWQSGKRGPLTVKKSNNKTEPDRQPTKPLKVKILKGNETDHVLKSGPQCGQCDEYKASMMCVECVENYCNICFVKFHHKGSLSKHHVRPLGKGTVKEYQPNKKESLTKCTPPPSGIETGKEEEKGSLLKGNYDEAASAAMFQDALKAWRNPSQQQTSTQQQQQITATCKSCGVQANTSTVSNTNSHTAAVNIEFTNNDVSSSSYFDRLLLKRVKTNPSFYNSINPLTATVLSSTTQVSNNEVEESPQSSTISPYNIFYNTNSVLLSFDINESNLPPTVVPISTSSTSSVIIEELPSSLSLQQEKISLKEEQVIIEEKEEEKEIAEAFKRYTKRQNVTKKSKTKSIAKKPIVSNHTLAVQHPITNQPPLDELPPNKSPTIITTTHFNIDQSPHTDTPHNEPHNTPSKQSDSQSDTPTNTTQYDTNGHTSGHFFSNTSQIVESTLDTGEQSLNNTYDISSHSPIASKGPFSLSTVALNESVKQTWIKSSHSTTPCDLSCLFMNSVNKTSNDTLNDVQAFTDSDIEENTVNNSIVTTGCVWLPTNSIPIQNDNVITQFDLPPNEDLPTNPSSHNVVYDSSDSESDNDTITVIDEDKEDEEEEEDEELVRELTSTHYIECGQEEQEEEEEEEEGERVWSRMTIEDLIHDFDIFQDQVRQEDDTM